MGLSPHQVLSVIIIVCFLPAIYPALLLCLRHRIGKQWGWLYLVCLALLRVVGAALQISSEETKISGLRATAMLLSSVGVMTLLLGMLEVIENIKTTVLSFDPIPPKCWTLLHLSQYAAFILSIVGASTSRGDLNATAAIIVACLFAVEVVISIIFYRHLRPRGGDRRLIIIILVSIPFLSLRVIYVLLSTFTADDSMFDRKNPNIVLLAIMQYLMEFIVCTLFLYAGFVIPPVPKKEGEETSQTSLRETSPS